MCFMKGLRVLTISNQLGLVKNILLNIKKSFHGQNLLYHLVDHVSETKYLLPFKSNVPRKIVLRNRLKKHSSSYATSLIIFKHTSDTNDRSV